MPNGKISEDLTRIKKMRNTLDTDESVTDANNMVHAVLEVAYQIAMLRGDVHDLIDADEAQRRGRRS